jgi:hypothetical protein
MPKVCILYNSRLSEHEDDEEWDFGVRNFSNDLSKSKRIQVNDCKRILILDFVGYIYIYIVHLSKY